MKRLLAFSLLITLISVGLAHAQPDPLSAGFYQAEDTAIATLYSGAWINEIDGGYSVMLSETVGDGVSFESGVSGQLIVYRELLAAGGAVTEICVAAFCSAIETTSTTDMKGVPFAVLITEGDEITISNTDGGLLRIDSFFIVEQEGLELIDPPLITRQLVSLADDTIAAVDQSHRPLDVVIAAFLAAIATLLIALLVTVLWRK